MKTKMTSREVDHESSPKQKNLFKLIASSIIIIICKSKKLTNQNTVQSEPQKLIYSHWETKPFLCNSCGHDTGKTSLAYPETSLHFHFSLWGNPRIVTFLKHMSWNEAPSTPSNIGAFLESTLTTLLIYIPFTLGIAFGSHLSSGWSFEPLLNLIGTFSFSKNTLLMVIFEI